MKPRIGVIISGRGMEFITAIEPELADRCNIVYLPFYKLSSVVDIYKENFKRLSGIVFTGGITCQLITQSMGEISIPHAILNFYETNLYTAFLKIVSSKQTKLNRISTDILYPGPTCDSFEELVGKENMPYIFTLSDIDQLEQDFNQVTADYHLSLYQQDKIDIVLTRRSVGEVLFDHIPEVEILSPSPQEIVDTFNRVINDIHQRDISENLAVVGLVFPAKDSPSISAKDMYNVIDAICRNVSQTPMVKSDETGYQIVTTNHLLQTITHGYTSSEFKDGLNAKGLYASVGWGIGRDFHAAYENAKTACREAKREPSGASYICTEDSRMIGPLSDKRCISYLNGTNPQVDRLSTDTGLSPLYIQKIAAVMKKLSRTELDCNDIAYYLGISVRSANRILNKLEESGVAISKIKRQDSRGRPIKIYKLDFKSKDD